MSYVYTGGKNCVNISLFLKDNSRDDSSLYSSESCVIFTLGKLKKICIGVRYVDMSSEINKHIQ